MSPILRIGIGIIIVALVGGVTLFVIWGRAPAAPPTPAPTAKASPKASPSPSPTAKVTVTPAPTPTSTSTPTPTILTLEEKIASFRQAVSDVVATRKNREVSLTFSEAEFNWEANKLLTKAVMPKEVPLEVKSVLVTFEAGNSILMDAQTTTYGFNVTLKVRAQVKALNGKPDVQVSDVNFGIIPIPQAGKDKIVALIKQKTNEMLVQLTRDVTGSQKVILDFTQIAVKGKELLVNLVIKPG